MCRKKEDGMNGRCINHEMNFGGICFRCTVDVKSTRNYFHGVVNSRC